MKNRGLLFEIAWVEFAKSNHAYEGHRNLITTVTHSFLYLHSFLRFYTNGEKNNAYRILVGKPEGKRPLG
jgi:hypothetical protein